MTVPSAESATRDMRRFVEVSFGHVVWISAIVLVVGTVQAIRVGPFSSDYLILLAGGALSIVSGTYLYVVHVKRVDQSSPVSHSVSAFRAFLIASAETSILLFGLYLLLFRGLYRLYVLLGRFQVPQLLSALGFLLLATILLNGVRKLRKVSGFLGRLEATLTARRSEAE